ncbi:DUF4855 domain-containing protein [bacterium]|nr:DUF4855 domain-containing protein [bacterium]
MRKTVLGSALVALLLVSGVAGGQEELTYLPPGTPEVGGVNDIVLIYHGLKSRPAWTREAFLPYVAYVERQGKPRDWFFDAFLFIEFASDTGAWLHCPPPKGQLPTPQDWVWLADAWFRPAAGLVGLDQAVAEVAGKLGPPDRKGKVIIGMPIPFRELGTFGPLPPGQQVLDMTNDADRLQAVRWYVQRVMQQWREHQYRHLDLLGFYWTDERRSSGDWPLCRQVSQYLHGLGMKYYQIPYIDGQRSLPWPEAGFDAVMRHPIFYTCKDDPPLDNLRLAAKLNGLNRTGFELELDMRVLEEKHRERLTAVMDSAVHYGWMNGALMSYYEGGGALLKLAADSGPGREVYDNLYAFVKGNYSPSGKYDFSALPILHHDNTADLALASRGAKVHGLTAIEEGLQPEMVIDGNYEFYDAHNGYAALTWPASFVIELPAVSIISRTQVMFFDHPSHSYRYQYTVETSVDGQRWYPAVDQSEGDVVGWQVDTFPPRQARYVRFNGLHNAKNSYVHVVEFEVYSEAK